MLERVVKKTCEALKVETDDHKLCGIKLLDFTTSIDIMSKMDRQCVVDAESLIEAGSWFTLPDGKILTVSYKQLDVHNKRILRYILDCVEATHKVNITRTILMKNTQGGLADRVDTVIYAEVPVKIGLSSTTESKVIDVTIPRYVMYISKKYELQIGDRISIDDPTFDIPKVNSFMHITPGLMEITFDKDPRWA